MSNEKYLPDGDYRMIGGDLYHLINNSETDYEIKIDRILTTELAKTVVEMNKELIHLINMTAQTNSHQFGETVSKAKSFLARGSGMI